MLNQHNVSISHQLTAADFITNSVYTGRPIINETKTTTVPSYIRTGDSYFHQKEHHINTMVQGFGLPQIFYTMTMAEIIGNIYIIFYQKLIIKIPFLLIVLFILISITIIVYHQCTKTFGKIQI